MYGGTALLGKLGKLNKVTVRIISQFVARLIDYERGSVRAINHDEGRA